MEGEDSRWAEAEAEAVGSDVPAVEGGKGDEAGVEEGREDAHPPSTNVL